MTDSPFSFQTTEDPPAFSDEPGTDGRRNAVLFGALGAVVLAAGAFFFLGGGGDETDEVAFTPSKRTPRVEVSAAPLVPAAALPAVAKVPLGRNPFRALYVQPVAAPAPAPKPPPPPPPPPPAPAPIVVVNNVPPPAAPQPAPAPAQRTVQLLSVATPAGAPAVGTFLLDGKQLTGSKGMLLGGKLLVLDLQQDVRGWFALLQFGESAAFEVSKGQEVVIQ